VAGEYKAEFASDIKGTHDVYFVVKGNPVTVDSWYAIAAGSVAEDPVVPKKVNPYNTVEAETAAELKNAEFTSDKKAVNVAKDGYIVAKNADFSKGLSGFSIIASSSAPNTAVNVFIDKMGGEPVATIKVTSMGECKLVGKKITSDIKGKHDVYIAADGKAFTIDSWYAVQAKDQTTPEQPTSEEPTSEQPTSEQPTSEQPAVENPTSTGMKLDYTTNSWPGAYLTSFKVTNASGKAVDSWKLKIKKNGINITQSWCVNIDTQGDYYVVTPLSWNSSLKDGQYIEFGIIASGEPNSTVEYVFE
ncbi:MAG: cellulose binding domain-containing protein, partial [Eubacterium sp.]|nr:cellulose binding domain-containing protein [Eubacterium sp.]